METGTYNVYVSTNSADLTKVASLEYGEKPKYTLGDVNDDGAIDTLDALWILQCYAKMRELSKDVADVDHNNKIDTADALRVLQYYAELITSFG